MANNILNNIGDSETVNKESLVDRFVKEAGFFEHAVIVILELHSTQR